LEEFGGIYYLEDNILNPIFEGIICTGLEIDENAKILLSITRSTEEQIIAIKIKNQREFEKLPVELASNYICAFLAHDMMIYKNKIIVIATNGLKNDKEEATNEDVPWEGIGKIIVSDIKFDKEKIIISESVVINPFGCNHHHHINDICFYDNSFFLSAHTYCDKNKKYFKEGVIAKLNEKFEVIETMDKFRQPHSLVSFRDRLFVCSSSVSSVMSVNWKEKSVKLEYKGVDSYVKALLVTDEFFFIGLNYAVGRTNSKFKNPVSGLLKFNRWNGKTDYVELPEGCTDIYDIKYY